MATNQATASWKGGLKTGSGQIGTKSGILNTSFSFESRFGNDESNTNPEELVGAAHAACFTMFLSSLLEKAGKVADNVNTTAEVELSKDDRGPFIKTIRLKVEAKVPDIQQAQFDELVQKAKTDCPISRALNAVGDISVEARLL